MEGKEGGGDGRAVALLGEHVQVRLLGTLRFVYELLTELIPQQQHGALADGLMERELLTETV